jgi:CRISPR-associated protein Cas5d
MLGYPPVAVKVWGDFACWTRPEMKVERVSYEVMTPSGARGVLESIFWKPEFKWLIRSIHVLREVRFFSLIRNEVNSRAVYSSARRRVETGGSNFAEDDRAQRHTLALRDVAYIITADVRLRADVHEDPAKYRDQFRRRMQRGQCHHTPYLGCREFAANFSEPDGTETAIEGEQANRELGMMLFDIRYATDSSGRGQPRFFQPRLENGILHVPAALYKEGA